MEKEKKAPADTMSVGEYVFELKKLQHLASRSEETNCFSAVLYVNGKKFADCGNSGHGGPTDVNILPECRELGKTVTAFLAAQPKAHDEELDFDINLDFEYIVDTLVGQVLEAREMARLMRKTVTHLLFEKDRQYYTIGWKFRKIAELLLRPDGREVIREAIAREVAEGGVLMNENIPEELLPAAK